MSFEQMLPEEINVEPEELKINDENKKYVKEVDGVFYGGDYLEEPPAEIDIDFPSAPPESPHPAI